MANKIKKTIERIHLLLLLVLWLGYSSILYAAQNDEVDEEKENFGNNAQGVQQYASSQQASKTIVLKKHLYRDFDNCVTKISSMVQGKEPIYSATSLDVPIFNQLILGANDVLSDVQKQWDAFRHQPQRIIINMWYMYDYYQAFMPLLFDPNCKNLILLNKMVQLFPNVTEIICKETDRVSAEWEYSADIVSSNFILAVQDRLSKMKKHAKLTKVVIQTHQYKIADKCKLYPTQFSALGWKIGKGNKTIALMKMKLYDFSKISSMIRETEPAYGATSLDVAIPIVNKLIMGGKDIPADMQKQWDELRHQQKRITINMKYMYKYYKVYMPLLFDPKCKNLLQLDKIAQLFPNVTEIICKDTDNITGGWFEKDFSYDIVCSKFIEGVKDRLHKVDKHAKLTKIVIQTYEYGEGIKDDCKLYPTQFRALGWQIGKGNKTIALMKMKGELYDFSKISSMIRGTKPAYGATSLDVPIPIVNKLIMGGKNIPADVQKQWDTFKHQQQRITINMWLMYRNYKAFMLLLTDINFNNLLLLDTIVQLFPNATEIICAVTDYDDEKLNWRGDKGGYSADIVSSNFILGVKERLSKLDKQAKLTKIVIQTENESIQDECKLYATEFGALGWKIERISRREIILTKSRDKMISVQIIRKLRKGEKKTSTQIRWKAKLADLKKEIKSIPEIGFNPAIDDLRVNGLLLDGDDKPLSSLGFSKRSTVYVERDTLGDNNTYTIKNPFVVTIAIATYDCEKIDNLPSVQEEVKKLRELFRDTCKYKFVEPKKEVSTLTRTEMMDFIVKQRNYLSKSGHQHDALIFFYSGHGANHSGSDLVLCSDATLSAAQDTLVKGHEYFLNIKDQFCSIEKLYEKPKIFFNLGCRSVYEKVQSSSLQKVKNLNNLKKDEKTLVFYATHPGYKIEALATSNIVFMFCKKLKQSLNKTGQHASLSYILEKMKKEAHESNSLAECRGPLTPERVFFSKGQH